MAAAEFENRVRERSSEAAAVLATQLSGESSSGRRRTILDAQSRTRIDSGFVVELA